MLPSSGQYTNDHTMQWAATIAGFDGFVFVTPEYNHSIPCVLKIAIDYLYAEWNNKAAAFVSYATLGGTRTIEHLRGISSELQIAHVRQQLDLSLFTDFESFEDFAPEPRHDASADTMLNSSNRGPAPSSRCELL